MKLEMNQGATSSEYSSALAKARGKRDVIAAKMCQLLEWREMLDARSKIIGKLVLRGPVEPVILRYFELHEKVKEEKHLGKLVCDKKVINFAWKCILHYVIFQSFKNENLYLRGDCLSYTKGKEIH